MVLKRGNRCVARPFPEVTHPSVSASNCFAHFRASRRKWVSRHIERYTSRQEVIDRITELGGTYVLQDARRYLWSYGQDFAEIMRQLVRVELPGPKVADSTLDGIDANGVAGEVVVLVLKNSAVSDAGLLNLRHCKRLRCLDLRNTTVSNRSVETLNGLPRLESLQLHGTRVGFWARRRLRRANPQLQLAGDEYAEAPAVYDAAYEHAHVTDRIAALQ
jgi:hypothetical protein